MSTQLFASTYLFCIVSENFCIGNTYIFIDKYWLMHLIHFKIRTLGTCNQLLPMYSAPVLRAIHQQSEQPKLKRVWLATVSQEWNKSASHAILIADFKGASKLRLKLDTQKDNEPGVVHFLFLAQNGIVGSGEFKLSIKFHWNVILCHEFAVKC